MSINEILVTCIGGVASVLGALIIKILNKYINQLIETKKIEGVEKLALEAIAAGVEIAKDEFVRKAKIASSDGKLTDDEIKLAREIAYEHAIHITSSAAKELLKKWAITDVLNAKIKEVKNA